MSRKVQSCLSDFIGFLQLMFLPSLIGFYRIYTASISIGLNRNFWAQSPERALAIPGKHSMSRRVYSVQSCLSDFIGFLQHMFLPSPIGFYRIYRYTAPISIGLNRNFRVQSLRELWQYQGNIMSRRV